MLLFCPTCGNMLTISKTATAPAAASTSSSSGGGTNADPSTQHPVNRFECRTCPYQYILDRRFYDPKTFPRKPLEHDDVLGGKGAWDNVDRTAASCPNEFCSGQEAFWYQVQIRSADEPMTSFLRCVVCGREWRE